MSLLPLWEGVIRRTLICTEKLLILFSSIFCLNEMIAIEATGQPWTHAGQMLFHSVKEQFLTKDLSMVTRNVSGCM